MIKFSMKCIFTIFRFMRYMTSILDFVSFYMQGGFYCTSVPSHNYTILSEIFSHTRWVVLHISGAPACVSKHHLFGRMIWLGHVVFDSLVDATILAR